ncbi:MAG: single-stranded-DNA-specific exonuclease RecJ [Candidatus Paceibacterota bacterium]
MNTATLRRTVISHPLTLELLTKRGITSDKDITDFLNPNYDKHLHDPFLLKDMDKAVSRILTAIKNNERIIVYTDYDTDGIPAGVIFYDFFTKIGFENFQNYIPHRNKEGYGLNKEALRALAQEGASVIITADCGITDNEEVALASSLGIDVIITDHHLPSSELPPAYAVVNPKREDDEYPFKELCGCGVAFKLIEALLQEGKKTGMFEVSEGWEKWLLDMVGLATISDMVPLVGENRVLAYYGLKVLRRSSRPGLVSLLHKANVLQQYIEENDVGFSISPRINAASRMDTPFQAFEMLTTKDEGRAAELVSYLEKLNKERKVIVAGIVKEAHKKIKEKNIQEIIVLGNPHWQPGLLGLAANTLAQEYGVPVFLWGRGGEEDSIKGSCRGNGLFSVVACMERAGDTLLEFGGHRNSGGFSVAHERIHTLEEALLQALKETPHDSVESEEGSIERELSLDEVGWDTHRALSKLAPFGIGNPRPLFLFKNAQIDSFRWFGKGGEHIELSLISAAGRKVKAISFFAHKEDAYATLVEKGVVSCVAYLEKNTFMGRHELRLRIAELVA